MIVKLKKKTYVSESTRTKTKASQFHLDPIVDRVNWGILNVSTDTVEQWVKNCKTGWAILRKDAELIGKGKDGHYYWRKKGDKVMVGMKTYPSVWAEGELPWKQ
jgi:hypothetical protein